MERKSERVPNGPLIIAQIDRAVARKREQIAQEIENMRMTIVSGLGGVDSHSLAECRHMREEDFKSAQKMFARIVRGEK